MAINLEELKWAINDIIETVNYEDEDGNITEIAVTNKAEPLAQFKNSGALFEEPIPRAYLNFILNRLYLAVEDLETRVTNLEP